MKLSIVLSTYNGEAYITDQLDSILNQTRKADEVLIFDDCSTDNTPQIIEQFISGHNLTTWKFAVNHENKGWKRNFMEGIWNTLGDLVFPCDQDDIWMPKKLEQMEKIMIENPKIMVLTSNYESFYDSGKRVCGPEKDDGKLIKQPLSNKVFNIRYPGCTYCIRREFVEISKKHWQVDFPHDALFWRMGMFSDSLYSYNVSLIQWRKHTDSTFTKESNRNRTYKKKLEFMDYAMRVVDDMHDFVEDKYSISFLNSISYTENCYHCQYANIMRVSDITLGDSWGSNLDIQEQRKGVSLILNQTLKGKELLEQSELELMDVELNRAIEHNHQLKHPSIKPNTRKIFFDEIKNGKNFNAIVRKLYPKQSAKQIVKMLLIKAKIMGV